MTENYHVLLIGIDAYDGGGALMGCVNDIDAVQRLLIDRVGIARNRITRLAAPRMGTVHETDVPERLPTLDNLRGEFSRLGTESVAPCDRVLIYYSGHGTQCLVADESGRRFSREAILPKDKIRGAERRMLFDWELNEYLARIAARAMAVTVILDCCSSAGATRAAFDEASVQDRFWHTEGVYRLEPGEGVPGDLVRGMTGAASRVSKCLVVAACQDDERARESAGDGESANGELTRALVRRLTDLPASELADLRWGRIWRTVQADVRKANPRQNPWLSGGFGRRVFGFGPDEEGDQGFTVVPADTKYRVDVGTLAGVTEGAEIAIYGPIPPTFPPLDSSADHAARKGLLQVCRAERATCEADAMGSFDLPEAARGRLCKAGRDARLRVALAPHDARVADCLAKSPLVELATGGDADLTLARRSDGGWALTDDVHGTGEEPGEPLLAVIPANRLDLVLATVEHYHAYSAPLRIARGCCDLPNQLRLWLLDCNGVQLTPDEAQNPDLPQVEAGRHAPYEVAAGDHLCAVVENGSDDDLSVALIDCAPSGRVLILGEKRIPKRSRHAFWYEDILGNSFVASLPAGQSVGVDRLVAIGTTRCDVSLRHLARAGSFEDMFSLQRACRDLGLTRSAPPVERWTSALTALRITCTPGAV
jgi:hypothetical protein